MNANNAIAAYHIESKKGELLKLATNNLLHWHIPKRLRKRLIQKGDIVLVDSSGSKAPVLVMDVYREECKETKKQFKQVIEVLEKAPVHNEVATTLSK